MRKSGSTLSRSRLIPAAVVGIVLIAAALWLRTRAVPHEAGLASLSLPDLLALARRHPGSEPVYVVLGVKLSNAGRSYEAVTAFEQAATNDPRSARALEGAATVLAAQGKLDDAAQHFVWCLRLEPERVTAREALGRLYQSARSWRDAEEQFRWLTRLAPGEAGHWLNLGACRERQGKRKEALAALEEAARLAPADPRTAAALRRVRADTKAAP